MMIVFYYRVKLNINGFFFFLARFKFMPLIRGQIFLLIELIETNGNFINRLYSQFWSLNHCNG